MILLQVQLLTKDEIFSIFREEFAKEVLDETGWWFRDGTVMIVRQPNEVDNAKTILHEVTEYLAEVMLGLDHKDAHDIANEIEKQFDIAVSWRKGCGGYQNESETD